MKRSFCTVILFFMLAAFHLQPALGAQPAVEVSAIFTQDKGKACLLLEVCSPEALSAFTLEIAYTRDLTFQRAHSELDSSLGTLKNAEIDGTVTLVFCDYTGGDRSLPPGKHAITSIYFNTAGVVDESDFTITAAGFADRLAGKLPVVCLPVREQKEVSESTMPESAASSQASEDDAGLEYSSSGTSGISSEGLENPVSVQPENEPEQPEPSQEEHQPGHTGSPSITTASRPSAPEAESIRPENGTQSENKESASKSGGVSGATVLPVQNRSAGWYFPVLLPVLVVVIGGVVWIFRREKKDQESDEKKERGDQHGKGNS